ncbi:MAG: 50S ribosomal protein L37e [Candidatus Aenigmarchaeota archaeon]|nr:50S ribosomal protein L37e [Candidatus Aenigmarchaeota archaeon]
MVGKGTPSFGKRNKKVHIACRRCGKHAYHIRHHACSACGFGNSARIRGYAWQWKSALGKGNRLR